VQANSLWFSESSVIVPKFNLTAEGTESAKFQEVRTYFPVWGQAG